MDYLIQAIQNQPNPHPPIRLNFNHPITELIWLMEKKSPEQQEQESRIRDLRQKYRKKQQIGCKLILMQLKKLKANIKKKRKEVQMYYKPEDVSLLNAYEHELTTLQATYWYEYLYNRDILYDYQEIQKRCLLYKEELIQLVYQPKNIAKFPHWKIDEY